MAETFRIALRDRSTCGELASFRFDKPSGYTFRAGQFLRLTLETAEGRQTKSFSHAEAPDDAFIEIATRLTGSAYKNALDALVPGGEAGIQGPFGRLALGQDVHRACFLVGGVGVTPARSIIRDAWRHRPDARIRLFFGNQEEACIPYSAEFDAYAAEDADRFERIDVIERPGPGWHGEQGLITAELVRRHIDPSAGWHFYVTGPPAMVTAMRAVLSDLGVSAKDASIEDFTGYGE